MEKPPNNLGDQEEFRHKEIANVEEPMRKIFEQISGNFERGEYDLMIGTDASGRIPALIIFKLAKHIYEKSSHPLPMFRFIAGHARHEDIERSEEHTSELQSQR